MTADDGLAFARQGYEGAATAWADGAELVYGPMADALLARAPELAGQLDRAFGGPKLAPTVSPGKTRSGSTAGVIGGIVTAPASLRVGLDVPLWQLLVIAGVLSVVGQIGDLAESLFKREAGVKDSSQLIRDMVGYWTGWIRFTS